jgi:hypothetical protein
VARFCEHCNEPLGSIKKVGYSLTSQVTTDFSRNILHHGFGLVWFGLVWFDLIGLSVSYCVCVKNFTYRA